MLCINKNLKMWQKHRRHIKPSSWLKAIYWWMVCLWNQFFILNVTFTVLQCRLAEIFCWNIHGTSFFFPMAHKFDWCEREGRWMKIVWGWLSGDMGRLQRCSISAWNVSDRKWQLPYGFKSRHDPHTNKQTAHRQRHRRVHIAATDIYTHGNKLGLNLKEVYA